MSPTHEPPPFTARRLPVGAELTAQGAHFRVWAPEHPQVSVVIADATAEPGVAHHLMRDSDGYHSGFVEGLTAGALYRFQLGDTGCYPDPASRFQPQGPDGPSQIIDPDAFTWTDATWKGLELEQQVLYEFHVGTFTAEGTWRAAAAELQRLADLGITALEMLPIADFAGSFGWGYDGVNLFAPTRLYGEPDDLRRFIDRAHALGLGVILDVVYNHFGPRGNYIRQFTPRYFSTRYENEWGDPLNFDEEAAAVREFMIANAAYWIREYHFDGLRLDATQQIFDATPRHIIAEVTAAARQAAGARSILVVGENEPQDTRLLMPVDRGGCDLDALWNDDFHHTAIVALTGRREAYYTDYAGSPQEFISAAKRGFLYQGQRYAWQKQGRGQPTRGVPPRHFITFLENHDQVANGPSGHGERLWQLSQPSLYRALTALWLLSPGTPMFFQGQERGSAQPFMFFADHPGELGEAVRRGRAEFMSQFRSPASRDLVHELPDPAGDAFERCRAHDEGRPELLRLHRDLLTLRRTDPVFRHAAEIDFDGAVLSAQAFVLRWYADAPHGGEAFDRLVVVNLGLDLRLPGVPEPMLAPVAGTAWALLWSSEEPAYGGQGTAPFDTDEGWRIPGRCTAVLAPTRSHS